MGFNSAFKVLNTVQCLTPALCPQTVDLTARLPAAESSSLKSATIRVLVVDPEGLVTIYSPVSPIQSVAPAVTLGSDVNSKVISKVMAGHRKKINTEVAPTSTKSPSAVSTPQQCGAILARHNLLSVDCVWNVMAHAQKPDFVFRAKRTSRHRVPSYFNWTLLYYG